MLDCMGMANGKQRGRRSVLVSKAMGLRVIQSPQYSSTTTGRGVFLGPWPLLNSQLSSLSSTWTISNRVSLGKAEGGRRFVDSILRCQEQRGCTALLVDRLQGEQTQPMQHQISRATGACDGLRISEPIGSMYGIYANIWGILMVNVTSWHIMALSVTRSCTAMYTAVVSLCLLSTSASTWRRNCTAPGPAMECHGCSIGSMRNFSLF